MAQIIIGVIVYIIINVFVAGKFDSIANMKGHEGYFSWCFVLGVIGWAMVIALPDRNQSIVKYESVSAAPATASDDERLPEL